jgi:glutamate synthase (NADPH/NADH) small chain
MAVSPPPMTTTVCGRCCASLVVWAVREGQDAAADIHHYLQTELLVSANANGEPSSYELGAAE